MHAGSMSTTAQPAANVSTLLITPLIHANVIMLTARPSNPSQQIGSNVVSQATLTELAARLPNLDIPFL